MTSSPWIITQHPDGRGLLHEPYQEPVEFPSPDAAYRALREAERLSASLNPERVL